MWEVNGDFHEPLEAREGSRRDLRERLPEAFRAEEGAVAGGYVRAGGANHAAVRVLNGAQGGAGAFAHVPAADHGAVPGAGGAADRQHLLVFRPSKAADPREGP